jgi:hypothetical protein
VSRDLTAGLEADVVAASLRPALFYEGVFTGGTLRLWTGLSTIDWNGYTWTGAGNLLAMSQIEESLEIKAAGLSVTLSGLNPAVISLALAQARQGLSGKVWLGTLAADNTVTADPFLSFEGRLDVPEISDDGESCTVVINYESRLIDLERARERRITHEDQQIEYPGDLGRQHVARMQDQVLTW